MKQLWVTSEGIDYIVDRSGQQIVVNNNTYQCYVGCFESVEQLTEYFEYYLGVRLLEIIDI